MDQIGLTQTGNEVASINLVGSDRVAIHLKARDSNFVASVLANNLRVVPEHVFAKVRHVSTWLNPNPVGSGPFAIVQRFGDQAYVLGRNPHYWLKGAPHFACVERVLGSSGESALLQMVHGDVDLTNNLVPNVQKAYVSHDPEHYHYFYPATSPIGLYLDDTKYPFSLVAFRKAISLAVDREEITRVAEYGYAPPVDAIGINRIWGAWADPKLAAEAKRLASHDPAAARRTLLAAGFTYKQGALFDPRGNRVSIEAKVIKSWSDWVPAWQLIARDLDEIGITVDLKLVSTWGDWQPDAFSTKVATLLWSNYGNQPTPYAYFKEHLDRASFIPSGQGAERTGNWEHFQSPAGNKAAEGVQEHVRPRRAAQAHGQARADLAGHPALRAALRRPGLVDLQHEALHGVPERARLLHRAVLLHLGLRRRAHPHPTCLALPKIRQTTDWRPGGRGGMLVPCRVSTIFSYR